MPAPKSGFTHMGLDVPVDPLTDAMRGPSGAWVTRRRPAGSGKGASGKRAFVLVGLGFGDEGKGSMVDALVRRTGASLVVRYNGGAQAAHNVVLADGREHCFQMFGAGTLAGAKTYLSEYVLVNPLALAIEGAKLQSLDEDIAGFGALSLVSVNRSAPLTTPFHVALNRIRELAAGGGRHGSCGMGIGETMRDVLAGEGLYFGSIGEQGFVEQLQDLQSRKRAQAMQFIEGKGLDDDVRERIERELLTLSSKDEVEDTACVFETVARAVTAVDSLPDAETYVFEGAQGVLLDEHWGYTPHKTFSTTTSSNALRILRGRKIDVSVWGLLRAYSTRHGHGPLPTVIDSDDGSAALREGMLAGEHNVQNAWQENFRVGYPDEVAARYAALADGNIDGLIVTCLDRLQGQPVGMAVSYGDVELAGLPETKEDDLARTEKLFSAKTAYETVDSEAVPERLAQAAGVPLVAISRGATAEDKEWHAAEACPRFLSDSAPFALQSQQHLLGSDSAQVLAEAAVCS